MDGVDLITTQPLPGPMLIQTTKSVCLPNTACHMDDAWLRLHAYKVLLFNTVGVQP